MTRLFLAAAGLLRSTNLALRTPSALLLILAAAACEPPDKKEAEAPPAAEAPIETEGPPEVTLVPTDYEDLPGWAEGAQGEALAALERSCNRLSPQPDERPVGPGGMAGRVADWRGPCDELDRLPPADAEMARRFFESWFQPVAVLDVDNPYGIFTGYYEAELDGARERGGPYQAPLLAKPEDMVTVNLGRFRADLRGERLVGRVKGSELVPYYTREEIEAGALDPEEHAFIWAKDPVDAFFLHIQGSGLVTLPDGEVIRVGYAAHNGHEFVGIGRLLLERGLVEPGQASAQGIRKWLRENPEEGREIMQENPRYIFFQPIDGDGPIGAQGVALTAGRSLAVDTRYLPLGAPVWLDTTWPGEDKPLRRLMVAQDTGGAIKGVVRGDFFWGPGEEALKYAGRMKQRGRYWLLLPREVVERRRPAS